MGINKTGLGHNLCQGIRRVSPLMTHQWVFPGGISIQRPHRHLPFRARTASDAWIFNNHLTCKQQVWTFQNQLTSGLEHSSPRLEQGNHFPTIKMFDHMNSKYFIRYRSFKLF